MKFSYEWLRQLVKFQESPEKLAEILTMGFAETEAIKQKGRAILNIDLLSNRVADASGHLGVAREISAILGKKFEFPKTKLKKGKSDLSDFLKIKIETKNCRQYEARLVFGVKVKESPLWLQNRLKDCGLRPINNIVDIANYVMLETGQPLHAFDFDKLENNSPNKEIIIRQARLPDGQAKKGEKIITLENKTYELDESAMVIAGRKKPLAIAGIKGGKTAEVDKKTKNLVLESANFNPLNIRLSSKKLGIRTDASWRFEHNLDLGLAGYAVDRLALLIQKIAGGEILNSKKAKEKIKKQNIAIPLKWERWERFLGWQIKKPEIKKYLYLLGFGFQERKDYLLIFPPLFRNDIKIAEDVMGEVIRILGMDKLPVIYPKEILNIPAKNESWELKLKIKNWLKDCRLEEVFNHSLISLKDKENLPFDWQKKLIEIENPTSELFRYLRPTILLNFLKNCDYNFGFTDEIRFFEIGNVYPIEFASRLFNGVYHLEKTIKEEAVFSGILAKKEKDKSRNLFYEAKGIIEGLFESFGIDKSDYSVKSLENSGYFSLLENGAAFCFKARPIGVLAACRQEILEKYGIKGEAVFWEIKISDLLKLIREEMEFEPLPQHPAVIRDISFVISKNILIDRVLGIIQNAAPSFLEDADLFDIYEGENLPENIQSLSFHLIFRSKNKTLTSEEINKEMEKISKGLKNIGAEIR